MNPHSIRDHFQARQNAIIDMIGAIVEIESPSLDAERSRAVVRWVEQQAEGTGLDIGVEKIAADGCGEHLIIRAFPSEKQPVLLLGHTDTVHPVGAKIANPTRREDGRLYGCGIFDMKANVVLMLEALRYFAKSGIVPPHPITILLSCDEEVGSHMGRGLVEREAAGSEFCCVLEPSSDGRIKTGRKGTAIYTVKAHGIPAHAGLDPEKGANAILEIALQVPQVHQLADRASGTTVNVCTAKGGTTSNVIPEHAECSVDVRFSTMDEALRIDAAMHALQPFDARTSLEVAGGINRPPMERTDAVAALFEKARGLAASFDYELGETQVGGASDGNFVAALGIPVLDGLGIAGDGAHTLAEYILMDDIVPRATLITMLLNSAK